MEVPATYTGGREPPDNEQRSALTGQPPLGKEDFLLMLVAQLSNQDPLNPLEGHEFAAQLAQFSSVEQLIGLNDNLSAQAEAFNVLAETMSESLKVQVDMLDQLARSMNLSAATSMIGMTVEVPGDKIVWSGEQGDTERLAFQLDGPAEEVMIHIRDADGKVVASIDAGSLEAGRQEVVWNGTDAEGNPVPEGTYTFEVTALDENGEPVSATTFMEGSVERVSFGPEGAVVWVHGEPVPIDEIVSLVAPPAEEDLAPEDSPSTEESTTESTPPEGGGTTAAVLQGHAVATLNRLSWP